MLPGWPRPECNCANTPAGRADVDGDGLDEIFTEEEDWRLHAYKADGSILPGWPVYGEGGQERHTPAIAELDGDGIPEIVSASGSTTPGVYLLAYHRDGTSVDCLPVLLDTTYRPPGPFPTIGTVAGTAA